MTGVRSGVVLPFGRLMALSLVAGLAAVLWTVAGCGVDVDVPDRPPTSGDIRNWSDASITKLEEAIRKRDPNLPSKTRPVVQYLYALQQNLIDGSGARFENPDETLDAITRAIEKLDDWYNRSRLRREGETDRDYAELQTVVDEVKQALSKVKTGD
ncbi:MAG TPA: hypothetical protein VMY39_02510 [Planctomycetota bacterium]|nr:hypothetical protein [Planctomycetota bacterium]HUV38452.1 hypothetical protein [Planctomycetota bacterium]